MGSMELEYRTLPQNVQPMHYSIFLFDLDRTPDPGQPEGERSFSGRVLIDLAVKKATQRITLNAHHLNILSAGLIVDGVDWTVHSSLEKDVQRCHFDVGSELLPGTAQLAIEFQGARRDLVGFYQSSESISCTQFQPSDARRAFPCFDEPAFKATFALSIEAPSNLTVLGNMPLKFAEKSDRHPDHTVSHFETTPRMSTYIVAWAIGEFDYCETLVPRKSTEDPFPVRVYTPKGMLEQGKLALDTASKVLQLFAEMFDIDYPLPKADLVAVPEMSDDAMENWGLVLFRESALLLSEEPRSCPALATHVEYIIAHELAHMWFGNLVTMSWWDSLWLNEGFATWAGWYAVDKLHPDWDVWSQFLVDDMQEAFDLDSMPSSHPVQVHVADGLEVDSIFDAISYLKGASIIRMLAAFLGEDIFLTGVTHYLKRFSYQNVSEARLWESLRLVSGQDVALMMQSWVGTAGFPVLTAETKGSTIELSQTAFRQVKGVESQQTWYVPIVASMKAGTTTMVLKSKTDRVNAIEKITKINTGHIGFYRTELSTEDFLVLAGNPESFASEDRAGLVADAIALTTVGRGVSVPTILSVLPHYADESQYSVWYMVLECMDKIRGILPDREGQAGLDNLSRRLIERKVKMLGWDGLKDDTYNDRRLRSLLLRTAGLVRIQPYTQEALKMFEAFLGQRASVVATAIRASVLDVAVSAQGLSAVEPLWRLYQNTNDASLREDIVDAVGQCPCDQAQKCLDLVFDGGIAAQDLENLARAFTANPRTPRVMFEFMRRRWTDIQARIAGSMAIFERFVRWSLPKMAAHEDAAAVESFFAKKDTTGYTRGLRVAIDSIRSNAAFREREERGVRKWLEAEG